MPHYKCVKLTLTTQACVVTILRCLLAHTVPRVLWKTKLMSSNRVTIINLFAKSPIALALDRLQGQKSESMAFIGALIPTLMTVKQKLTGFTQSPNLRHWHPMASAMLAGLERRFGHLLNLEPAAKDYIIAAVSHPYFKLRWVPFEHVEQCRLLFTRVN